jgi:hypothetical protein
MRNLRILLIATCLIGISSARLGRAQQYDTKQETQMLKARQKDERKTLKLKHKYRKESMKGQPISKALREQAKHEMDHEIRELHEKQRNELQQIKDRQRQIREFQ